MSDTPEDRFGDLGGEPPAGASAAERFEHEDRVRPEPDMPPRRPPGSPRPGNKYAWAIGILALIALGFVFFTVSLPHAGQGVKGPSTGERLPDFAAPAVGANLACSKSEPCDANVCQRGKQCSKASGKVPACEVRGDQVVNICELRRKPLVLTFIAAQGTDCEPQIDRVERMRRAFPQVNFAAVVGGEELADASQIAKRRGWDIPVAVDHDGAVLNLYGVGVCPTTVFSEPGGKVHSTRLGNLTEGQLSAEVRRLIKAS